MDEIQSPELGLESKNKTLRTSFNLRGLKTSDVPKMSRCDSEKY